MSTKSSILLTVDAKRWYFCGQGVVRACASGSWDSVMDEIAEYSGNRSVLIGLPSMDCFPFPHSLSGKIRPSQVAYDAEPVFPMRAEEMVVWTALGRQSELSVVVSQSKLDGIHEAASRHAVQTAGFFPSVVLLVSETIRKGMTSVCIETSDARDVLEFTDGVLASWQHMKPSGGSVCAESQVVIHDESNRYSPEAVLIEDLLKNLDAQAVCRFWRVGGGRSTGAAEWLQSARVLSRVFIFTLALVMISIGFHRRTSYWNTVASSAHGAQEDIFRELMPGQVEVPFSIADRLRSESQVAFVNMGASADGVSAASSFFQLLSSMPEAKGWEVKAIHSTGRQATVTGVADDAQIVPVFSKTLSQVIDSEYSVSVIPKVVRHEDGGVEFTLTVGYEAP